ncbi:hypothetical protein OAF34_04955 [Pirellulaceae bacterium]|nr:hypothetical protein [Pirellulaceae bacterium]
MSRLLAPGHDFGIDLLAVNQFGVNRFGVNRFGVDSAAGIVTFEQPQISVPHHHPLRQ